MYTLNFDGSAGAWSYVLKKDNEIIHSDFGSFEGTVNQGEYRGMIMGLEYCLSQLSDTDLLVLGDSQLVIRQMTGHYKAKHPRMSALKSEAKKIVNGLTAKKVKTSFKWIPRHKNNEADKLTKVTDQPEEINDNPLRKQLAVVVDDWDSIKLTGDQAMLVVKYLIEMKT